MKGITGNPALDAYHRMAIAPVGAPRPVERADAPAQSNGGSSAASVTISARARDLASEAASSSVDTQKVEAVRQRIANGSFQIDPQVIAGRMIEQLG